MRKTAVRQADIVRALKAVQKAGVAIGGVEVRQDGTIRVLSRQSEHTDGDGEAALAAWRDRMTPK